MDFTGTSADETVTGTSGVDTLDGADGNDSLDGGDGNDQIYGGPGDDNLVGGEGHDLLVGQGGNDTLTGGNGDDYFSGGGGDDSIDGGAGIDRASFYGAAGGITIDLNLQGQVQNTGLGNDVFTGIEQVNASPFNDVLIGDSNANWLWGGGGADTLTGGGGDDLLTVGKGDSHVDGNDGVDALSFYSDTLDGPVNVSLALQGQAQVTGQGTLTISNIENLSGVWNANDTLAGDGGSNILAGWSGSDSLSGGSGDDTLVGDGLIHIDDHGTGGAGPITVILNDGDPTSIPGADTLDGGAGADSINAGAGNDLIVGGIGNDIIDGGAGTDTLTYASASAWVNVDLGTGIMALNGADKDFISNVENVIGSNNWDKLVGDGNANLLSGGEGHDYLSGAAGNDTLQGGNGDDFVSGGAGDDVMDGGAGLDRAGFSAGATGGVNVSLALQGQAQDTGQGNDLLTGFENLSGTRYSDSLTGDGNDNWIWGGSDGSGVTGNDSISAGLGNDLVQVGTGDHTLDGGGGTDALSFEGNATDITSAGVSVSLALQGSAQATGQGSMNLSGFENLSGSTYGDSLTGDSNANLLAGYDGSDSLVGGAGNDTLSGDSVIHVDTHGIGVSGAITVFANEGTGNDTLVGGAGNDLIDGGAGADVAVFSGNRADYNIAVQGNGDIVVTDLRGGAPDGVDTLRGVESLSFADGTILADNGSGAPGGGPGNDNYQGGTGADTYSGDGGDDTLQGGDGADSLSGADGYDFLRGQNGDDTLAGGNDDDFLNGGAGNDLIDGGAGIDRVSYNDAGQAVTVDLTKQGQAQVTGFGTDTLVGIEHVTGTPFNDVLTGDGNANWLWAAGGADTVAAGAGDDLVSVGNGAVKADGGAGLDTFEFYSNTLTGPVSVSLALQGAAQATGQGAMTLTGFENLVGTLVGGDSLTGDAGANILAGWGGADSLSGGSGDDTLLGDGTIFVDGGPSGTAGSGPITAYATDPSITAGADTLDGGAGNDSVNAGDGDDLIVGGTGNDTIDGGAGTDTVTYASAAAWVNVDLGAGTVAQNGVAKDLVSGVENVIGSNNWDKIVGDGNANLLAGGVGHDYLAGGAGNDTLQGGADDDFVSGGAGDDVMDGGAGLDRAAFSAGATGGVTVSLALQGQAQNTGQGNDLLTGFEHLSGTRYSDSLTGDGNDNWLWGGSDGSGVTGNDSISAGLGNDLVQVGTGDHTLDGGGGTDALSFQGNVTDITAGVAVSLALQGSAQATGQGSMNLSGFENLSGSTYGDSLTGDSNANLLAGYDGSDSLSGGGGNDTLSGDSVIHVDTHGIGVSGAITVFSGEGTGNDTLDGGSGDDLLQGEAGDDKLIGGTGNDTISGGTGADTVIAQAGASEHTLVTLGAGADKLILDAAMGGTVTVTDFQAGAGGDVLDLSAYLTAKLSGWNGTDNPFTGGFLRLLQDGTSTLVQVDANGGGDSFATVATLQNTSSLLLGAANLGGYTPQPMVIGGPNPNTFTYEPGSAVNTVVGGAATDTLNITAPPPAVGHTATVQASPDGTALLFDLDGDGTTDLTVNNVEDIVLNGQRVVISGDLSGTGLAPHTIHYTGTTGDDLLDASGMVSLESVRAQGLAGADSLTGAGSDDTLDGGDGEDQLDGQGGPDLLEGGAGNDTITGGAGTDVAIFSGQHTGYAFTDLGGGVLRVVGADGTDRLSGVEQLQFDDGTFTVAQVLAPPAPPPVSPPPVTTPGTGTPGDDNVNFGVANDQYSAGAGSDTVAGGGGDDTLNGEDGADWVSGDLGNDLLTGGLGNDTLIGGAGNDTLDGGVGEGYLRGGEGDDLVTGGEAFDNINGNQGADTVSAGAGNDWVSGGKDADVLDGQDGADLVFGNMGADTVDGGAGDDVMRGGQDNDLVRGGAGNDWLAGDRGDDTLTGGTGADTFFIFGEAGVDRVTDFNAAEGDRVQLDPGSHYTVDQVGADTVISLTGGAQMILVGVQLQSLPTGWIFGA